MNYRTSLPLHETEFNIGGGGKAKRARKKAQRKAKKQCKFRSKNPGCKQRRR
jgi:hypothetical protein